MKIKEVMTKRVQVVRPFSTLKEAAQIMKVANIGPLPVCDGDRLVGVITDRDIVVRGIAEGHDPARAQVKDIMNPHVLYVFDDQPIEEAAQMMEEQKVRRLMVVTRSKRLAGILSIGDIAGKAHDDHLKAHAVERVVQPH